MTTAVSKRTIAVLASLIACAGVWVPSSHAVPWPLDNTGLIHDIWQAYGQWQEAGGIHLHEGIDLKVAAGTNVKAVAKGTIVNIHTDAADSYNEYITISDDGNPAQGWGYVHVKAKAGLKIGDTVNAGDVIGTIQSTAGVPAHLHFERDSNENGGWPNAGGGIEHLDGDPVNYLDPRTDNTAPTIERLKYRRAEDEDNDANPKYFTTPDCGGRIILGSLAPTGQSGNVDVLASAYDKFAGYNHKLSVQDITFHAFGRLGDNTPVLRQLVNFEGSGANDFAQQENDNFTKLFRNAAFAQAIYENDSVANSADASPFWYIVTNQDTDQITEIQDAPWFWDTDGVKAEPWNDQLTTDERAANNAKDKFRDDFYDIYINVSDEANNVTSKVEKVLLDNWLQTVLVNDPGLFELGDLVGAKTGEQHQESDPNVPLFIVRDLIDCELIVNLGIVEDGSTTSNENGVLAESLFWTADEIGMFYLISDYDDDGFYHPRLDGVDFLEVTDWIPEPGVLSLLAVGAPALLRRRRSRRKA